MIIATPIQALGLVLRVIGEITFFCLLIYFYYQIEGYKNKQIKKEIMTYLITFLLFALIIEIPNLLYTIAHLTN